MVLDSALELLLKYRPSLFAQGRVALDASPGATVTLVLAGGVLALAAVLVYARTRALPRRRDRALLAGLRVGAVALVVACLLRPVLVLAAAVPRRNTVAILVDDSRSMRIADADDAGRTTRAAAVRALLAPDAPLRRALDTAYAVRVYRFSDVAARAGALDSLAFAGDRSRLGAALDRVRGDLAGLPLAGMVVVSDGADHAPAALAEATAALRAQGTPVFAVGVGREAARRDLEVRRVEAPRVALAGGTVQVDALVAHAGLDGARVAVVAEEDGRIVARREVVLARGADATPVRLGVPAMGAGVRRLTVRVPVQEGEALVENNARSTLLDVRAATEPVLYVEGEPRFEAKFVRRAVADDDGLRVALLQRTARDKWLRLGLVDSTELLGGFPLTREALFRYRAVVIGSIEASAFDADQLRMLADFASVRGGGVLFLGGRRAFAEGGYAGTPLEELLPFALEGRPVEDSTGALPAVALAVRPTAAGLAHAPLQLAPGDSAGASAASAARWRTLPPLTAVNVARRARPGATVLLEGTTPNGERRIALAWRRYGRGKVAALPVQDTWLWQMHADVPLEDQTHETLWKQTLRWLVADVPAPVEVVATTDRPAPGERVDLRATVRDSAFVATNGARVVAEVVAPSGARREVPLAWSLEGEGEYRGSFVAEEPGVHEVRAMVGEGAGARASEPLHVEAAPSDEEWFESGMRAPLLRRLAEETGGRFYTPATVGTLPEDLRYARAGVTVTERRDLWDMPLAFLLLGGLLTGEWAWRRKRGLA